MDIKYGAKSDVGLRRKYNEDRLYTDPHRGLYLVCDGMGGHNAGEVASRLAVDVIARHFQDALQDPQLPIVGYDDPAFSPQTNRLASAIRLANQTINTEAHSQASYAGMGTTVVAALLTGQVLSIAHVGDSRLYLIRGDGIQSLTTDHSLVAEQIREGMLTEDEAERSPRRNIVTRALGVGPTVDVDLNEIPVMCGDTLVLCSDGLTRGVKSHDILQAVLDCGDAPQSIAERLVTMANAAGGEDNTTVVVIIVPESMRPGAWRRLCDRIIT